MKYVSVSRKSCMGAYCEICRIPSYVATFPFMIKDSHVVLSKIRLFIWLSILAAMMVHSCWILSKPSVFYLAAPIVYITYCIEQICVKVSLFIGFCSFAKNRRLLQKMLLLLMEVEQCLLKQGLRWSVRIDYSKDLVAIGGLVTISIHHFMYRPKNLKSYSKLFVYYLTKTMLLVISIHFKRLVLYISSGFKMIRHGVERTTSGKNKCRQQIEIERMIICYHKLYIAAKLLNKLFAPLLLLMVFSCFLITTGEFYFFYRSFNKDFGNSIVTSSWISFYAAVAVILVFPCPIIQQEAKDFNTLLYQMMIDDKTNDISNNNKLRLHIGMKREVIFTACGFFTLDYTLVHSMIAAATTYLVILIQFGQPSTIQTISNISSTVNTSSINSTENS